MVDTGILQVFALILSGWAIVIQITLRRLEDVGSIVEYREIHIGKTVYIILTLWLVFTSAILLYNSARELKRIIVMENSSITTTALPVAMDALSLLIPVVLLTFLYSTLSNTDKPLTILIGIVIFDLIIYLSSETIGAFNIIFENSLIIEFIKDLLHINIMAPILGISLLGMYVVLFSLAIEDRFQSR